MKDKFIELFGHIDPKLVADAKPIAQKPIELRAEPSRFSWKKLTAAAACLAVLGAGGAVAVKMMNSQSSPAVSDSVISEGVSLSAADSGHSDAIDALIDQSSMTDDVSAPETSVDPDTSSLPAGLLTETDDVYVQYSNGTEFEYEGKIYKVISSGGSRSGRGSLSGDYDFVEGENLVVGVRREIIDGVDTVEFAAFVENIGTNKTIGVMSSTASPDQPILFRFELNDRGTEVDDSRHWFENYEFRYMPVVIKPGERFYQTASFPVTEAEYMFSTCCYLTDADRFDESKSFKENQNGGQISNDWVDFSDKSVSFDDVYTLFGASNYSKELEAAWESRQ